MSAKGPVIKFSPFEALLIGEKNKILKRQPMKNTIFVTRLNQRSKTIDLRDLFGIDKTKETEYEDVIFKIPQRVSDFFKNKKLENRINKINRNDKKEILCYEFEGHKMIAKGNENILPKVDSINEKLVKVKLKRKFRCKDNISDKVVKKFPNYYKPMKLKNKIKTKNPRVNQHLLRGKDGKFIRKSEYEKLKHEEVSPKQKYLSNYLHHLYLKKNKEIFSNVQLSRNKNSPDFEMPFSVKTILGLPSFQFDISASETLLNEISERFYENNCYEDFQFPKYPNHLKPIDFENDVNLIDIIYGNFPKFKFKSESQVIDFNEALLESGILKVEKNVKMYEKKKNGFVKDEEIRKILNGRYPLIKLRPITDIISNHYQIKNGRNLYANKIDEPYTKKSHLITSKSFGSFFFRSSEGKDVFIGNLMKPFFLNSWFGSLPES